MYMKYYSEKTSKLYNTIEELEQAELELENVELAKRQAQEKKDADFKKLSEMVDAVMNALNEAKELVNSLQDEYGFEAVEEYLEQMIQNELNAILN